MGSASFSGDPLSRLHLGDWPELHIESEGSRTSRATRPASEDDDVRGGIAVVRCGHEVEAELL